MTILSAEQIAQVAYQAGFRGAALNTMVAIAWGESGRNTQAYNGAGGDNSYGLWQINMIGNLEASRLKQFGITSKDQLFDPLTNAKAAYILSGGGGNFTPWTVYTRGTYKNYLSAATVSVSNAYSQGLMGQDTGAYAVPSYGGTPDDPLGWKKIAADLATSGGTPDDPYNWKGIAAGLGGSTVGASSGGSFTPSTQVNTVSLAGTGGSSPAAPFNPPTDAQYVRNAAGWGFLFFDVGGVTVSYMVPPDGSVRVTGTARLVSDAEWAAINPVDAGMASELESVSKDFGSFRAWWDSIVLNVMGTTNPATNDAGVKRVLAEYAGRPDMSTQELQNRLQATSWYQSHSQTELQWNNLSAAEKDKQRADTKAKIADAWMQYGGFVLPDNNAIFGYVEHVASGQIGFGAFIETIIKPNAANFVESPWNRQVRDEAEATRQRPVDIENTTNRVRDLANKWGVQLSNDTLYLWGKSITEKTASDQDYLEWLKDQAGVLYPWKDRQTDTTTAAQPWLDVYKRTMEKEGSVLTPQVGAALSAGTSAWDFETSLKSTDDWLGTKNAKETMTGLVDAAGRRFGYA